MIASPLRYSLLAALVLGGLGVVAAQGTRLGLAPALLLLPLIAWPCWLGITYHAAVRKAQARALLRDGATPWWTPLLGGGLVWKALAAIPLALLAAWSAGWSLVAQGWTGLAWIVATAALTYPVALWLARQTGALKPYVRLRPVLRTAPLLTAAILTGAWLLVEGTASLGDGTLAERIAAEPRYEGSSALLAWAVDAMGLLDGTRTWGLALAEGQAWTLALLWRTLAAFGQFWLLGAAFAGLLLPSGEARRILRVTDADMALPAGPARVGMVGFVLTLLTGMALSAVAEAEGWAATRQRPDLLTEAPSQPGVPRLDGRAPRAGTLADAAPPTLAPGLPTPTALREIVEAEQIGSLLCPAGTIAGIETMDQALRDVLATRRAEVERAVYAGFDAARARVPLFLDGYYSLTAEYLRTFHLVAGDAEPFLEEQLTQALGIEEAFVPVHAAIEAVRAPLPAKTLALRDRLQAECGLLPRDDVALQVTATAPAALLGPTPDLEAIAFEARLAASGIGGVAGGVAGAVAGKVIAKLVASEVFGLAAETVAKLAMGKAAGGLGGAAIGAGTGAVAGSVVPGVGTTIGAVVGGVVGGLAVGVATDYALIRIEEAVSREAFEAEILAAINAAEAELLASLFPPN
jgi:hypothetical protein